MPKATKKRRHGEMASSADQVVVASLKTAPQEDSIESLLAEMAKAATEATLPTSTSYIGSSTAPSESAAAAAAGVDQQMSNNKELFDPTLVTTPITSDQRERVSTWNRAMHVWKSSGTYTPGLLPSFDVEVARHFKVQSLSSFLLEACKELKMPAFERW